MIYDSKKGNIINQYITFTKVCDEQVALHGRTREAIFETIRICKDKNVLKEYLENREREVVDIMMALYDEEEIMRSYVRSEVQEAVQEAVQEENIEFAKRMLKRGKLSIEEIAEYTNLSVETILQLQEQDNLQSV